MTDAFPPGFRRVVFVVAMLNLSYFFIEFIVALQIGSVSLFADSVDFLEDASINLVIFVAAAWSLRRRATVGSFLAVIILIPTIATLWMAVVKMFDPSPPAVVPLSLAAIGALAVNLTCAVLLARHRNGVGSLAKAAWLSARNDAFANVGILVVAVLTAWLNTGWFDIALGLAIGVLNADAARSVWNAARAERASLAPEV